MCTLWVCRWWTYCANQNQINVLFCSVLFSSHSKDNQMYQQFRTPSSPYWSITTIAMLETSHVVVRNQDLVTSWQVCDGQYSMTLSVVLINVVCMIHPDVYVYRCTNFHWSWSSTVYMSPCSRQNASDIGYLWTLSNGVLVWPRFSRYINFILLKHRFNIFNLDVCIYLFTHVSFYWVLNVTITYIQWS